jgi:hypothetical protein
MGPAKLITWWNRLTEDQHRAILANWPHVYAQESPPEAWLPRDTVGPEPGGWTWEELAVFLHAKEEDWFQRGDRAR